MSLGTPRLHLRATDSTNLRARALASVGAPHGTLVTAGEQHAGRGRQGRAWTAPAGRALLMSTVVRDPTPLLSLAAAVAVADVCAPRDVAIKWPNDVLVESRKVAGILVEGRPQEGWAVLGIGLNVALRDADLPEELRARATGLGLAPDDVEGVLERLLAALDARLGASDAEILAAWRERDWLRGRAIAWNGGSGVADGVDDAGHLLVRTEDGAVAALDAGEVHLERVPLA